MIVALAFGAFCAVVATIALIAFKANYLIEWPWRWILSPLWIYMLLAAALVTAVER